jgi:protein SCO1/2
MALWRLGRQVALAGLVAAVGIGALGIGTSGAWHPFRHETGRLGAGYFPNVVLTNQDGQQVHFYDDLIKNKTVAINFIYSHCGFSCPLETARLSQVQKLLGDRMGKDVFFYSISIDPEHDTPPVLKQYAETFGAGPGWMFLTGKSADIDLLAMKLGLSEDVNITAAPGQDIDGHTPHLLLGNAETGQWLRDSATDNPRFLSTLFDTLVGKGGGAVQTVAGGTAGAPLNIASAGQYLFTKECAACHTVGHGDKIGPDLADAMRTRDPDWIAHYIREPDKMLADGDPAAVELQAKYRAVMPNLRVGDHDLAALMEFLAAQAGKFHTDAAAQHAESGQAARTR